jgi:signal transduction histidine kinase
VGKGTGQGLAIVRRVVIDRHGGSIDVQSTPGKGARFVVRLPIEGRVGPLERRTA